MTNRDRRDIHGGAGRGGVPALNGWNEDELAAMFGRLPVVFALLSGPEHVLDAGNAALFEAVGGGAACIGEPLHAVLPRLAEHGLPDAVYRTGRSETAADVSVMLGAGADAREAYFDLSCEPRRDSAGRVVGVALLAVETTRVKHAQQLALNQRALLEHIARDAPLEQVLTDMATTIETLTPGLLVSVLLADGAGRRLRHGTAPSLPEAYNRAIDGIPIGEGQGSCGTAAYRREPVVVTDIAHDPLWADYRAPAARAGLAASWSTPILAPDGELLGTFAMYHRSTRAPHESDRTLAAIFARTAALAVERHRAQRARAYLTEQLQTGLRPSEPPDIPGHRVATYYRPAEGLDVGGDFYDVFPLGAQRWGLVMGDVCGHGAAAAATTGLARHTLRAVARLLDDPAAVVDAVNTALLERAPHHGTGFVTLVYGRLTTTGGTTTVDLVRAGHLPPLVRRAGGGVEALEPPGALLGMLPDPRLGTARVRLDPGDSLVLVTDGITEARSRDGEQFGETRLHRRLATATATDGRSLIDGLVRAVDDHTRGAPSLVADDRAALALTREPGRRVESGAR